MQFSLAYSDILKISGDTMLVKRNNVIYNLAKKNFSDTIFFIEGEKFGNDVLRFAHTPGYIEEIKKTRDVNNKNVWEGSIASSECVVGSIKDVLNSKRKISFALTSYGGHHAFKSYYFNNNYLNHIAVACGYLKLKCKIEKILVIDVDSHHADGTFDILQEYNGINLICFHSDLEDIKPSGNEARGFYDVSLNKNISGGQYISFLKQYLKKVQNNEYEFVLVDFGSDVHFREKGFQMTDNDTKNVLGTIIKTFIYKPSIKGIVFRLAGGSDEYNTKIIYENIFRMLRLLEFEA